MIQKFFSNQSKTITGAALLLGTASALSRIVGIARDHVFANLFGAGDALDVYYASFRIPDLIYNLIIVGALAAGFIPVFTRLYAKETKAAWEVANSIINLLGLLLLLSCGILFLLTPRLLPWLVPGFPLQKIQQAVLLTRILFLSPIILGLSGIAGSILQSRKAFAMYALSPIFYNLGIIVGAVVFVPIFGLVGLAYGVILGASLHLAIQLPSLFVLGFRYRPIARLRDPAVREIALLMIPRTLGLAASQLNLTVITIIASTLGSGSIAIFTLANNLQSFPIGIIGISFAIAAFPTLATFFADGQIEAIATEVSATARQILFFILPITVVFVLLRAQLVRVALGSGKFDWPATIATSNALAFFALSLFAQCLIPLLIRTFYALHNTWTPFILGLIAEFTNLAVSLLLKDRLGIVGLALAFSLAMLVQTLLLWLCLRRRLGSLQERKLVRTLGKMTVAIIPMILATQLLKYPLAAIVNMNRFWGIFTQGVLAGGAGLTFYFLICAWLRVEEMERLKESLTKRWLKFRQVPGEIPQ